MLSPSHVEAGSSRSLLSLLPRDVLLLIFRALKPRAILADLAATCHELCTLATSDDLWRLLVHEHFRVVIDYAFDGVSPSPLRDLSWRAHYYDFSATWMLRAREAGHIDESHAACRLKHLQNRGATTYSRVVTVCRSR